MSDQGVFLSKWPPNWRIILAKEQLGHSYIFWTMPILIFCQFANFGNQSLVYKNHAQIWNLSFAEKLFEQSCETFWIKSKMVMKPGFLDIISQHKVLVSLIFASQRLTHQRQRPFMFYSQYSRYIQNIHTKVIICYLFFSFYHA